MNKPALGAALLALVAFCASPAFAQEQKSEPKSDIGVAYTLLYDKDAQHTFPVGWAVSGALAAGGRMAIVGEVGGSYDSLSAKKQTASVYSFMGGVRFPFHRTASLAPFFQALGGGVRLTNSGAGGSGNTKSDVFLSVQPGVGLDFLTWRRIHVRTELDYRAIFPRKGSNQTLRSKTMASEARFALGVAFPL